MTEMLNIRKFPSVKWGSFIFQTALGITAPSSVGRLPTTQLCVIIKSNVGADANMSRIRHTFRIGELFLAFVN